MPLFSLVLVAVMVDWTLMLVLVLFYRKVL
jgi:hypothetical protein